MSSKEPGCWDEGCQGGFRALPGWDNSPQLYLQPLEVMQKFVFCFDLVPPARLLPEADTPIFCRLGCGPVGSFLGKTAVGSAGAHEITLFCRQLGTKLVAVTPRLSPVGES
jgi:hypothetical protein